MNPNFRIRLVDEGILRSLRWSPYSFSLLARRGYIAENQGSFRAFQYVEHDPGGPQPPVPSLFVVPGRVEGVDQGERAFGDARFRPEDDVVALSRFGQRVQLSRSQLETRHGGDPVLAYLHTLVLGETEFLHSGLAGQRLGRTLFHLLEEDHVRATCSLRSFKGCHGSRLQSSARRLNRTSEANPRV